MTEIWKGAPAAAALSKELILRREALEAGGIYPCLAIVRVGEKDDDLAYERGAEKRCEKIGIRVKKFVLPADADRQSVLSLIRRINEDDAIHGCLMFRPLQDKQTEAEASLLLDPAKDVDCMTRAAQASVFSGKGEGYPPCTAEACMAMLKHYGCDPAGKRVTVIGRSMVIGRPVSMLLLSANATVTICHTGTADLPAACRNAEILISAAGRPGIVRREHVSPGQVILDVGISVDENGNLCGDVAADEVTPSADALTPVPGGIGAVTTAVLAKHVIEAAEKR